jgi:hypothetical protein
MSGQAKLLSFTTCLNQYERARNRPDKVDLHRSVGGLTNRASYFSPWHCTGLLSLHFLARGRLHISLERNGVRTLSRNLDRYSQSPIWAQVFAFMLVIVVDARCTIRLDKYVLVNPDRSIIVLQ